MGCIQKEKVLITGGLGFVGSQICREFLKRDVELFVLDNESRGRRDNIADLPLSYIKVDIRNLKPLKRIISDIAPSRLIHLAAMHFIPECNRDPALCMENNVLGTENILQVCRLNGLKRLVLASSMAVYPIKDGANLETDPPQPSDVYGESKLINEIQAQRFHRETGIDTVAVRLSNVYGPRETNAHVIPEIMEQLADGKDQIRLGNIEPKRDFLHVSDAARGFYCLSSKPLPEGFHIVNLGSGQELSIRQVLELIADILKRAVTPIHDPNRFRKAERMHLLADIKHISGLVGWQPQIKISEGIKDLCAWYGLI